MQITPLTDRVLVKIVDRTQTTPSGLSLPEVRDERNGEGIVVGLGQGHYDETAHAYIPMGLQIGQKVLFSTYDRKEVRIEGFTHLLLREDDILGIITD